MTHTPQSNCDCFNCDLFYDRGIKEQKAAQILGLKTSTLQKRRVHGLHPSFEKHGRSVVYRARVIADLRDSCARRSTSQDVQVPVRYEGT